jgi:hypothetical protein
MIYLITKRVPTQSWLKTSRSGLTITRGCRVVSLHKQIFINIRTLRSHRSETSLDLRHKEECANSTTSVYTLRSCLDKKHILPLERHDFCVCTYSL